MQRIRFLISTAFAVCALAVALAKPLSSRADDGTPPAPPAPAPVDTNTVMAVCYSPITFASRSGAIMDFAPNDDHEMLRAAVRVLGVCRHLRPFARHRPVVEAHQPIGLDAAEKARLPLEAERGCARFEVVLQPARPSGQQQRQHGTAETDAAIAVEHHADNVDCNPESRLAPAAERVIITRLRSPRSRLPAPTRRSARDRP